MLYKSALTGTNVSGKRGFVAKKVGASRMADPKLGTKRSCEACEAKFYDLNKSPATCPICGHVFDPDAIAAAPAPVRAVAPTAEAEEKDDDGELEEDEALLDDNDEDETLLEDDEDDEESFLETDEDDD